MFKRIVVISCAAAAVAAFALGVQAQSGDRLAFDVENDHGSVLTGVEVSPASLGQWRDAKLDDTHLATGDSAAASVPRQGSRCDFDVRARFRDGHVRELDAVDLCDLDSSTLVLD